MILLVDGATHTGKTNFAQYMLERYRFPYLCLDHIKMGLIRAKKVDFTPEDDEKIQEYLWPIVVGIIQTAIENNQNLLVEGCYIPEDWREEFEAEYLKEIRYLCLVMSEEYIRKHYDEIKEYANVIEKRKKEDVPPMEELIKENQAYFQRCITHDYECCLIEDEYHIDFEL